MNLEQLQKKVNDDLEVINNLNKDTFYIPTYEIFNWYEDEGKHFNKQYKLGVLETLNNMNQRKEDYLRVSLSNNELNALLDDLQRDLESIVFQIQRVILKAAVVH